MLTAYPHQTPNALPSSDSSSPSTGGPSGAAADTVDSARLLHGQREVLIRHGNEVYRLRHTRNDKLILTK
jgi:hemin uptake protein HemP